VIRYARGRNCHNGVREKVQGLLGKREEVPKMDDARKRNVSGKKQPYMQGGGGGVDGRRLIGEQW